MQCRRRKSSYQTAFQDFNFGLASAVSYVIFALVVFFAILNFRLLRSDGGSSNR